MDSHPMLTRFFCLHELRMQIRCRKNRYSVEGTAAKQCLSPYESISSHQQKPNPLVGLGFCLREEILNDEPLRA